MSRSHPNMTFRWMAAMSVVAAALSAPALAAGTLTPIGATTAPIQIRDHHVDVVINNGFARTEVTQTFFNPNDVDLEAVYACPVPVSASLSEVSIALGEGELNGEVLAHDHAQRVYDEETSQGGEAGLATRNGYQSFEFRVSPVGANQDTTVRYVYYQPLTIDTGVGRYLYPLEEGGTDEAGASFWLPNAKVEGMFSVDVELKSAFPIEDVRVPGVGAAATIDKLDEGHYRVRVETTEADLNRDFVLYYRLAEGLPGRMEMLTYRADPNQPGTFMMVLTPGIDLAPLSGGSDYTFVLDVSGSMQGKLGTLTSGVTRVIGDLNPEDRFRVIAFSTRAKDVTRGWVTATKENVQRVVGRINGLGADGSTNLYDGLKLALDDLDDDRATSIILVTDAVTNTGVIDPAKFDALMRTQDVRVFGFLMGNSANWPLLRTVCDASGGFHAQISNADDIVGQIMLAKSKVTHECLHDASLKISGVRVTDTTDGAIGKVYRGQQLVLFGRYDGPGTARIELDARLTGEDQTYSTEIAFPDLDTDHPELERLWAMNQIEAIEARERIGKLDVSEVRSAIEFLGVEYQLVTDHTSMVMLADQVFAKRGIDRRNQRRTTVEREARSRRQAQPTVSRRVDTQKPMFDKAPAATTRNGKGGGAIDPVTGLVVIVVAGSALVARRRRRGTAVA
ncbi:MAG: VWA domain-containing protein [Planctomycetes bacterium]|nr:VWA domain-containing protein [Planctomycetota bacterium]